MRLTELPDRIDLAFDETELPDDVRCEPVFVSAAVVTDVPEAMRLDPARVNLNREPEPPKRSVSRGSIGSLLLHLLPLLALIGWLRQPLDIAPPIPIQLVIEQPPPPPPPPAQPTPPANPPPGLRASDDLGEVGPPSAHKGADTAPPSPGEPRPPAAEAPTEAAPPEPSVESAQAAAVTAPPPPPKPTPSKQRVAARIPKPEGLELPLPLHPERPHDASASARYPGPNATRDEYCAYALSLTLQHLDLLPPSLVGARRGDTSVLIRVREDGTIISARVVQGSGYLDIDERVADMARAVGRYPPLPLWLPGPVADFTFHLHFPHGPEQ